MSNQVISSLIEAFDLFDHYCVFGHQYPDADCVGSQLVMGSWLRRRGKTVHLLSVGPWDRPEIREWSSLFTSRVPPMDEDASVATIFLDCSSPSRTGFGESGIPSDCSIVIDHHIVSDDFGDIRFIDPQSPSTTLLIQKIIEGAGDKPTKEEAEILFLGFCTDTGYFRFIEKGYAEPLEAVARLVGIGASPEETFRKIAGGKTLGSRKLLGRALDRAKLYFDGRVIITWETWKDWRELSSERDSNMLYQLLTGITGVEVLVAIREQSNGICTLSLRSTRDLDVRDIASFFGGGGHRKASGCTITGDRHDILELILPILADRLETLN